VSAVGYHGERDINLHYHNPVEDIGGDESLGRHADVAHFVRVLHRIVRARAARFEGKEDDVVE